MTLSLPAACQYPESECRNAWRHELLRLCGYIEGNVMDIDDIDDKLRELRPKRIRSRFVGSAGGIAFVAGAVLAGQCMIWLGFFKPGTTPNSEILNYWPGFLFGGVLLGLPAAIGSRIFYDFYLQAD